MSQSEESEAAERPLAILFAWFDWWKIRHWVVKAVNRRISPVLGLLAGIIIWLCPISLNLFGEYGVCHQINGLVQILAGFFIASLAAVATFNRKELDDVMSGDPPQLIRRSGTSFENLTRRRFLCLLFGYLAGMSILLYLAGAAGTIAAPLFHEWGIEYPNSHKIVRSIVMIFYLGALSNIIVTSFIGLYFLVDRMHQQKQETGFLAHSAAEQNNEEK
jgi:hypothetical protein